MEITVINDSHLVGWLASATRVGEIYMRNAGNMVVNVLCAADKNKISRLNIIDHGNSQGMGFGKDYINAENFEEYRTTLGLLRGHFTEKGFVHLQACDVGMCWVLLGKLAKLWGVPVYAGTGYHNPVYRMQLLSAGYVRCDADGIYHPNVSRP